MSEPFARKKNRRTERLVVLLTPNEEKLLMQHYETAEHEFSNVSEMIRDFIRQGLEATTKGTSTTTRNH